MKLTNRTKFAWLLVAIAAVVGLWFPFQAYLWKPYRAGKAALTLPPVPEDLSARQLGLPTANAAYNCPDLPVTLTVADLEARTNSLRSLLQSAPSDLCTGNQFREGIRYLGLHRGQFVIRTSSLPSDLAALAKDPNTIPVEEANSNRLLPDELEPARLFRSLASIPATNSPETQLQLGLSYVDLMTRQGGRESKAQLSTRSIEALTAALDRRPYMVGALYARGLNYLYWPVIAGKLPLAVRDLKICIAISNLPALKDRPPLVIAEAYRALGDAYVKFSDSTPDRATKHALLNAARVWWEEGHLRFPNYGGFKVRLELPLGQLPEYIEVARGLETYINTDLDLLWDR